MRLRSFKLILIYFGSLIHQTLANHDSKSVLRFPDVAFSKSLTEFDSLASVYQTLSRKPTCYQATAFSLMSACEVISTELSMDDRIDYAIRLTICDLEHAQISVPFECKRESQSSCLKQLESVSSWWISFASHYHDISHLCKLARLEFDKGISIEVNRNITLIQKDLLELLKSEFQYFQTISSDFKYETILENQKMISLFQDRTEQMDLLLENEKLNLVNWKSDQNQIALKQKESLAQSSELTQRLGSMKMIVHELLTQAYEDREALNEQFQGRALAQNDNVLKLLKEETSEFHTDYHEMLSLVLRDTENTLQSALGKEVTQFLNQFSTLTNKMIYLDKELGSLHDSFMKHSLAQQEQISQWKTEMFDLNNSQFEIFSKFDSFIKVIKKFTDFSLAGLAKSASGIFMLGIFLVYKCLKLILSAFKLRPFSPKYVLMIIIASVICYKYMYPINFIQTIKIGRSLTLNIKNYGLIVLLFICFIYSIYLLISRLIKTFRKQEPASKLLLLAPPETVNFPESRRTNHYNCDNPGFQNRNDTNSLGISESQWFLNDQTQPTSINHNLGDDIFQQKAWWE
ncbi:nuclear membrane protein [Schizosaccharomyces cryophilus OY26]|uniref:Nuclear fusion protein tht1 n=1 Tax=Schizosaccharomyces cryophilus (strain OY26 / ATCC MYA-4695 / CBS 11777 / NBRC 106824 / NRRL Y48691) TaxID=653667 RepID=S9VNX2_SCHCR|nr:nuclear membrane protein [Schizosaccharomyces cryophilus OY26]EPY49678.1 nuclear membrane protein [Schizosaccharomyces cryophilus OY26]